MAYNYNRLFEPIKINGMRLKNRISLSPMGTFTPNIDGTDSEEGIRYYEERAKGGAGLIQTGAMFLTSKLAQGSPTIAVDSIRSIPRQTLYDRALPPVGSKSQPAIKLRYGPQRCDHRNGRRACFRFCGTGILRSEYDLSAADR